MSFIPLKTYPIAVTGTATAGLSIAEAYKEWHTVSPRNLQAMLSAKTCDMVYLFSDSSTDTASVTKATLQTNGTFASDTGWTKGTGWTIAAGVATATGAISTAISQSTNAMLVPGRMYTVSVDVTRSAGSITPVIGGTSGTARSTTATFSENIIAGITDNLISFTTSGFTGTIDNVTVTDTAYPADNTVILAGAIEVNQGVKKFISVMSQDASSTGTLFLTVGYNET
jgi:hypothetical protein